MKNLKNKTVQLTISGVAILMFGIFMGYQLSNSNIKKIQGYLLNAVSQATSSNATNSNATSANATSSNATSSNATSANATSSNATSANYLYTDNIIYLHYFNILTKEATAGDKVYLDFATYGASLNGVSITLMNQTNKTTFNAQVKSLGNNPYIVLPNNLSTSSYMITDVLLTGINSDTTTFSRHYTNMPNVGGYYLNSFDNVVVTASKKSQPIVLSSLSINAKSAKPGDKLELILNASDVVKSIKLLLKSDDGQLVIYPKKSSDKWYFEIPSTAINGVYSLSSITLISDDNTKIYSQDGSNGSEIYNFNTTLEIKESTKKTYIYNNEDINPEIIANLYNAVNQTNITINADSITLINEELFNTIKGKNKTLTINNNDNQIVFNGNDITDSKTIDVSISTDSVKNYADIKDLIDSGLVVSFADNGTLPGKALVRIKTTDEIDRILQNKKVYVYYFNEESNNFSLVAADIVKTDDGYYEFEITHNSDYVLVNHEIDNKLVVADGKVVRFQRSNLVNILLISIGSLLVIGVTVLIVILKKKEKSNVKKVN